MGETKQQLINLLPYTNIQLRKIAACFFELLFVRVNKKTPIVTIECNNLKLVSHKRINKNAKKKPF